MRRRTAGIVALALAGGMCVPSSIFAATREPVARSSFQWVQRCTVRGDRPDPVCTPGALNPDVRQATIRQTICQSGWAATVRPPTSYTAPLKRRQIREYGYADTDPAHYEEDHLIPLELGGAPRDARNLWPEPGASPNPKDTDENRYRRDVCAGRITLAAARRAFLARWGPPAR